MTATDDVQPAPETRVAQEIPLLPWQLNVPRLHSLPTGQQEIYLLTHVAELERQIGEFSVEEISRQQDELKDELFKIVQLKSPSPGRVIRNTLGRCYQSILAKGARKRLEPFVNELLAVASAGKEQELKGKHTAVHCLGVILEVAGAGLSNQTQTTCITMIKVLKSATSDAGTRAAVYKALSRLVKGTPGLDEDTARSIWKQARSGCSNDRAYVVQYNACECLAKLIQRTGFFDSDSDIDKLRSGLLKLMDCSSKAVRRAAAKCLAVSFVKTWRTQHDRVDTLTPRRAPTKVREAVEETDRHESTAPSAQDTERVSRSVSDILRQLGGMYYRSGSSNRTRASLFLSLLSFLQELSDLELDREYNEIARYLIVEMLSHPSIHGNRYRYLITRKFVSVILDQAIAPRLGESAQLSACKFLLGLMTDEAPGSHKASLSAMLGSLSALIQLLGGALTSLAGECRDSLLSMLEQPSFAVQVYACIALRHLMSACPQEILLTMTICREKLKTELDTLGASPSAGRRCVAVANVLCSLISATVSYPIYGDAKTYGDIMQEATALLKTSASSDLHVSAYQVQVAWTLIGGLMQLGPAFAKVHLTQLLLIWKNTLSSISRDGVRQRSSLEQSYLCHVRESALTALRSFLMFNTRLVTAEVSRRVGVMLESTMAFLQTLPEKRNTDDPGGRLFSAFQLQDLELMARRRLYQCFNLLLVASPPGAPDLSVYSTILATAIASLCSADYTVPRSLTSSIASSIGGVEDIWDMGDEFGDGITSLVRSNEYSDPLTDEVHTSWPSINDIGSTIEDTVSTPICSAPEYDSTSCYLTKSNACHPAATEVVNAAIRLFALSLPVQTPKIQLSMVEQMIANLDADNLAKDPGRRSAITVNVALSIWSALRVVSSPLPGIRYNRYGLQAEQPLQDILRVLLVDKEEVVRIMASSALGMLCSSAGGEFTATQVNWLTTGIVNNRNPEARAGESYALASIHARIGSMAAGLHIRSIVGILTSLAADTHPLVHFWAIESLILVASSAGLNFAAYVNSSVGIYTQLYTSDDYNREAGSLASSNILIDRPVVPAIGRGVLSLIDVLGPDLQDLHKTRDMLRTLVVLFLHEADPLMRQVALKCQEALSVFLPSSFELEPYVQTLQQCLDRKDVDIYGVALDGLRNLMRRDAESVLTMASPGLESRLWDLLNDRAHGPTIQRILQTWLQQTALDQPDAWISRLSQIMTRTKNQSAEVKIQVEPPIDVPDEDVAGLAANGEPAKDGTIDTTSAQEYLPWQVRLYALRSLQTLVDLISKDAEAQGETHALLALQHRIGDLIRIAFSASTTGAPELRIVGLKIIEQVLHLFGRTPDPDFSEAMLLEQYQAQISSALTPAFAADSTPMLAAEAINVCATFISTGIVTDVDRMGRILKVLVAALDSASNPVDKTTIGELRTFSKNAQIMFRIAVFSAWADLQVSSTEQKYLDAVVAPYIPRMVSSWLEALKEYARLRYEPDITAVESGSSQADDVYASFNRQSLLSYYQDAWLSLVNAVASLIDKDSQIVADALDGKTSGSSHTEQAVGMPAGINYRDEPVAFFFVLFGLTVEAIATYQADSDANKVNLLYALRKILRPSIAGTVIYQDAIFTEAIDLLDRMALTDSVAVQVAIVEIATDLCMAHPSSRVDGEEQSNGDTLSEDIEQLFELTRIIVLVLGDIIPGISETPGSARARQSEEVSALVHAALQALVNVSDIFPAIIRTDLRDAILHVFIVMLSTGSCQAVMVPQSLPMFRRLVASMAAQPLPHTDRQLANALARLLQILHAAQEQDSDLSIACEKNVLLGAALLITSASGILTSSQWIVQRFFTEVQASLLKPTTSRVAVGCLRTILFAGIAGKRMVGMALRFMFERDEELRDSQALMANLLTTYTGRVAQPRRAILLGLVLLAIVDWAQRCGLSVHEEATSRIVELSQLDSNAFRSAFASTSPQQKQFLHMLLKDRMNVRRSGDSVEQEPTIALKLDFGGK